MDTAYRQWRLINVGVLFVGYGLYYLNRKSFVFLLPQVIESERLENNDLGKIASSMTLAYSMSKFVGGVLSDHMSPRVMFPLGLLLTGVMSLQFSVSTSVESFALISFLMGIVQGCGWPAVSKVLKQWFIPSEMGVWWSLVSSASNLAGTIGPLGLAFLTLDFGWRGAMQFAASGAIIIAAIGGFIIRSSPTDVGLPSLQVPNETISTKTENGPTTTTTVPSFTSNMWAILSSKALWVISLLFLVSRFLINGVLDWGQLYLIQEKGLSPTTGSSFTSAYSLGAIVGSISSGYITDKLVAKYGRRSRGTPRYPWLLLMVGLDLMAIHVLRSFVGADTAQEIILLVALAMGVSQFSCVTLLGVITVENSPIHLSGTSHAFAALAANVGGILAGYPLTYISQLYSWSHTLYCMEMVSLLGLFVVFLIPKMNMRIGYQSIKKTK